MAQTGIDLAYIQSLPDVLISYIVDYGMSVLAAIAILLVGLYISKKLAGLSEHMLMRSKVDPTIGPFLKNIVYYLLITAVVIAALGSLGVDVTSFLAVLGAASLAVGLALKDSLSNFAAGVMLLIFRFFRVGDYVTVAGTSGTVKSVNVFNTELTTPDNQQIYVPNGNILNGVIINVTRHDTRRLDLVASVSYKDDIGKAKTLLQTILDEDPRVLKDPTPTIAVGELTPNGVDILVRPWVKGSDLWTLRWDLLETIKNRFGEAGITIPLPQQTVHYVPATQPQGMGNNGEQ